MSLDDHRNPLHRCICGNLTTNDRFCGPCMAEIDRAANHPPVPPIALGWRCPVCLTVHAPSVKICECSLPPKTTQGEMQ